MSTHENKEMARYGYRASITLRNPPRAAKVPVTFTQTGRQAVAISLRIRFTEFS